MQMGRFVRKCQQTFPAPTPALTATTIKTNLLRRQRWGVGGRIRVAASSPANLASNRPQGRFGTVWVLATGCVDGVDPSQKLVYAPLTGPRELTPPWVCSYADQWAEFLNMRNRSGRPREGGAETLPSQSVFNHELRLD